MGGKITPMDYEYSKYFMKNSTIIQSAIGDFFFFEGQEAFDKEFNVFKEYVNGLLKRSRELKERVIEEDKRKKVMQDD